MAKEIDRHFVVKHLDVGNGMVRDSADNYETRAAAKVRAEAVAAAGAYAEVYEIVTNERLLNRYEAN